MVETRLAPFDSAGYLTGPDGVELYYRWWRPAEPTICLLAFHGLGAHGEWYDTLAGALLAHGVAVLAPDTRGHGLTRWDLGRLPGPTLLLEDAMFWFEQLRLRQPAVPIFLCGTSLGGCLATSLAASVPSGRDWKSAGGVLDAAGVERRAGVRGVAGVERSGGICDADQPEHAASARGIDGLVLLSPAFRPTYLGWGEKARMSLALLFGRETEALTPLGRGLVITGDRLRLQWLKSDPLAQPAMPARAHWNARALIRRARADLASVRAPILCIQGARDPVVDPDRNRALFARREGARFEVWEEAYHDLALEADTAYLAERIVGWVLER